MNKSIDQRLEALDIKLSGYREPVSKYKPAMRAGDLLFLSGQLSAMEYDGKVEGYVGQLGSQIGVEEGYIAARHCALGVLNRVLTALGSLEAIAQIVRLTGYINSASGFGRQHEVLDGCSSVLIGALGSAGEHTRLALGVSGLSFNASVEVDCIIKVKAV